MSMKGMWSASIITYSMIKSTPISYLTVVNPIIYHTGVASLDH